MNFHNLNQSRKENLNKEPAQIAPPRKKKKINKCKTNWPSFSVSSVPANYLPYMPCAYTFPYKCGFAIPLIPVPLGIVTPDCTHFHKDGPLTDNIIGVGSKTKLLKLPSYTANIPPLNDGSLPNLDYIQEAMNHNTNLLRNDSMPSIPYKEEKMLALGHQSTNAQGDVNIMNNSAGELVDAFRRLERNVYDFKKYISQNIPVDYSHNRVLLNTNIEPGGKSNLSTCCSPTQMLSDPRQSELLTFSQRIEAIANQNKESCGLVIPLTSVKNELMWILKPPPTGTEENLSGNASENEFRKIRNTVVKTLCIGQGLDQSDWILFQKLVSHSLPIEVKMKFLNAEVICIENINAGVASLRNSLLSISKYGESLLNTACNEYPNFSYINLDQGQHWAKIKGCLDILQLFGYDRQGPYQLCYISSSKVMDKVFVAELTLDILILAEEFRLYLDGLHSYPIFITQLFKKQSKFQKLHESFCSKTTSDKAETVENSFKKDSPKINIQEFETGPEKDIIDHDKVSTFQEINQKTTSLEERKVFDSNSSLKAKFPPKTKKSFITDGVKQPPDQFTERVNAEKMEQSHKLNVTEKSCQRPSVEDHIYEEISEVKAEIAKLYPDNPPPLPKKHKKQPEKEEININLKTKIAPSKCRRKRRAPMPPFFNSTSSNQATKNCKHPHKYNNMTLNSKFCSQCGKFSTKQDGAYRDDKERMNIKSDAPFTVLKENNTFLPARYNKNQTRLMHEQFSLSHKIFSRSMDSLNRFNRKQCANDVCLISNSLPFLFLPNKYKINTTSVAITRKESSIEKFENNKNLVLNRKCNALTITNNSSEHTDNKPALVLQPLNENKAIKNTSALEDQTSLLNLDVIPFIDSTDGLSSCQSDDLQISEPVTLRNPSKTELRANFSGSFNYHTVSAESLEVKEILFRKSTSDSFLVNDIFRTTQSDSSYREPIMFNAKNYKIDSEKQCEENRYEIPEIPIHERNGRNPNLPQKRNQYQKTVSGIGVPKRPYRKIKGPPLPPKPTEKPPPPLPPKGLLSNIATTRVLSKLSVISLSKSLSSPSCISKEGGSLPVLPNNFSNTGLVFVGNKCIPTTTTDTKSKKSWPNLFCSCLPKSEKIS